MRTILTTTLLLAAALGVADRAAAQGFAPYQRPPVSPYINLLRRGSDPAINYYGIVRPIVDQQTFNQQFYDQQQQLQSTLNQDLSLLSQPGETADVPRYPTTGHPTQLFGHLRYFQSRGSAGGYSAVGPGLANRPSALAGGVPVGPRTGSYSAPAGRAPAPR